MPGGCSLCSSGLPFLPKHLSQNKPSDNLLWALPTLSQDRVTQPKVKVCVT